MKYLAILKDSLREAIDNKVIYVMIALSLLVTLFVLTFSFKPLPAAVVMDDAVKGRMMGLGGPGMGGARRPARPVVDAEKGPQGKEAVPPKRQAEMAVGFDPRFAVQKVEVIRGQADSPESSYRVLVALPLNNEKDAEAVRAHPAPGVTRLRERLTLAGELGAFKVKDVRFLPDPRAAGGKAEDKATVFFEVTTDPVEGARLGWGHEYSLFWGAVPLGGGAPLGFVLLLSVRSVLGIGAWVTLVIGLIITAFFIPNMLRKGTIDLLLVKPIHRWTLLVYKYVGGLTFIFLNTTVAVVGMWLALGLRAGVWANSFLLMIFVYTFFFAILYAISALFGVLTRSSIVSILASLGIWFLLFLIGFLYTLGEAFAIEDARGGVPPEQRMSENAFWQTVRVIHFVLPRTSDINQLGNEALARDFLPSTTLGKLTREQMGREPFKWGESISVSLAFIAVMLGLACWRFATRDY
jgi:ABC-type transport system involved in multi-copper enzyme maturation permease subunit